MGSKWVLGVIAVISVAAMAGVGFAAYTATATATVNANSGSFYLYEVAVVGSSSLSSSTAGCTPGAPGSAITLTATNLLPGDFCNFTVTVTDPGSIGGNAPAGYISGCSGPCTQITTYAAWIGPYGSLSPASASHDTFEVGITDVGNGAVSESDTWSLSVVSSPV